MLRFYTVNFGSPAGSQQGYHLADLVVDHSFSEAEAEMRNWLETAGFKVENLPAFGDYVWILGAKDSLGGVVVLQKKTQPHNVFVACHVDLRGYDGRIDEFPDSFLYDLRLGLLLLGVDELGTLARPLRALNPSLPVYLDGLSRADFAGAIRKVRHAAAYITVTFDKFTAVPVLRDGAAEGPTN